MDIITDTNAVELLINTYMIKQLDSAQSPIDQEQFIKYVQGIFIDNNFSYSRKQILTTWKQLLETYYHLKGNFSTEEALETWSLFGVMDNCFDASQSTSEKFSDPNLTFYLIECLSEYKQILLNQGLTMNILSEVENKFSHLENNNINQKDIFIQWNNLKKCYEDKGKQDQSLSCFSEFLEAMEFYIYNNVSQNYYNSCISEKSSSENQVASEKTYRNLGINEQGNNNLQVGSNYGVEALNKCDNSSKLINESIINIGHCSSTRTLEIESENISTKKESHRKKGNQDASSILNKYETSYKELTELKELLLENNLLRKEFKYLLGLFSDKVKSRGFPKDH